MKKKIVTLLLIVLAIVLAACSEDNGNESKNNNENDSDTIKIGFSQPTLESPFYISLVEAAEEEAEKLGVELRVVDAQNDIEKQNSDIQTMLTNGIDVLLLNPTNPSAVTPSINAANDADVPVITVDRDTDQDVVSYIGRDNKYMASLAGEIAVDLLDGTGKIIELQGDAGGTVMMARHEGFHEVVGQEEGIEIIEGPYSDYIRAEAVSAMQDLLQAHSDVDLVYAHNDDMALGAVQVLKQANLLDQVEVVGIDGLMEALRQMDEGNFSATVLNDPIMLGKLAVQTAVKVANDEEVDSYIDGGTNLITPENVKDYLNEDLEFATEE